MSRSREGTWLTTRSPIRTTPPEISSSPATILSAVVLPQPEGPTRTTNSPSAMSSASESTALVPSPYTFVTSSRTTSATRPPGLDLRDADPIPAANAVPLTPGGNPMRAPARRHGRRHGPTRTRDQRQVARHRGALPRAPERGREALPVAPARPRGGRGRNAASLPRRTPGAPQRLGAAGASPVATRCRTPRVLRALPPAHRYSRADRRRAGRIDTGRLGTGPARGGARHRLGRGRADAACPARGLPVARDPRAQLRAARRRALAQHAVRSLAPPTRARPPSTSPARRGRRPRRRALGPEPGSPRCGRRRRVSDAGGDEG